MHSEMITRPSRKQDCLADLRQRILTLEIPPGADLDEAALAQLYELSRTPLREVLQRMAGEGYVSLAENRGAKVASMDLAAMRKFFQTAPLIYSAIARLAAENRTPERMTELRAVQARFAQAVASSNAPAMAMENHRFHELIGEMAANEYLMPALRRLLIDHTRLGQMFYRPTSAAEVRAVERASHHHDQMIAALELGEAARLVELTLEHWDLSRDRIERFVRPDPLPLDMADMTEKRHAV